MNPLQDINTDCYTRIWDSPELFIKKKPKPNQNPILHTTPELKYQEHQKTWTLPI